MRRPFPLRSLPLVLVLAGAASGQVTDELQDSIHLAIDAGARALIARQHRDGSWTSHAVHPAHHYDDRNGSSAFVTYTLLKSYVEPSHPALQRALAYLLAETPTKTYSIAAQILALEAFHDARHRPRIQELADLLREAGADDGAWGYPGHASFRVDLSNTQFAGLGLWAAHRAGATIPRGTWEKLAEGALSFRDPASLDLPACGFYYTRKGTHPVSGAMTAAGIAALCLAEERHGGFRPSFQKRVDGARAQALRWLDEHFDPMANPGHAAWYYYYLYSIERLGALLARPQFGGQDWYEAGAKELLKKQNEDGSWGAGREPGWPPRPLHVEDTCFALLFLSRATASVTGGQKAHEELFLAEDEAADVRMRATGSGELTAWITGFGEDALATWTHTTGPVAGLRIQQVEYSVDGEVVRRVPGDPQRGWKGQRYPVRLEVDRTRSHTLQARVHVLAPYGGDAPVDGDSVLVSPEVEVPPLPALEPWMIEYAETSGRERLPEVRRIEVSSLAEGSRAAYAMDGRQYRSWFPAEDDNEPWVSIELKKKLRTKAVLISQPAGNEAERAGFARLVRLSVEVNGEKERRTIDLDPDPMKKARVAFERPKSIRTITVRILAATGDGPPGVAEVEFERP